MTIQANWNSASFHKFYDINYMQNYYRRAREAMTQVDLPNLRHLRILAAVCRFRSVSRAALEVHLSQPAVTQAIAKIEAWAGTMLFDRRRTGCYPTAAANTLLTRVDLFFTQLDRAFQRPAQATAATERREIVSSISKLTTAQIRGAIALADAGSFEQAADRLAISVASLHRSLRELERAMQRQLFNRSIRNHVVNADGAELARRFRLGVRELEYGLEEISALQGSVRASIYIGVLPLFPATILANSVNELLACYPEARICITEGSYFPLLNDLMSGKSDVLLSVLRAPEWAEDVREDPLLLDPWAIAAREGHPLATAARVNRLDLARFEWVLPNGDTPRRRAFERMFKNVHPKPRVVAETNSLGVQRAILASSDRLTLLPRREIAFEERVGILKCLNYTPMISRRPDGIATRRDWYPTVVQRRFIDILRQQAHASILEDDAVAPSTQKTVVPETV